MADTDSVIAASPVSEAVVARAEEFTREPFLLEGEDPAVVLAQGTPRRRALDAALEEIEAGRDWPSVEWQREFALMLGLERLLSEEEPHLVDGTVLSAHQVDALSGTLTALLAEAQRNGGSSNGSAPVATEPAPLAAADIPGEEDDELEDSEGEEDEPQ